jgi:site-specific DNA recombinase
VGRGLDLFEPCGTLGLVTSNLSDMNQTQDIRYDVYLRKSSEAEDRQIQSIDDQRRELNEFAAKNGLCIVGEFEESQSAHHPGRPVFGEVMKRIGKGVSNGLLVWHANRTSRNPVDSGTIVNLIDEGKLVHVRTPSHIYGNTSTEKMMLALECMMAKKDSDDKSEAVKRGLRGRYRKGLPGGFPPIGFVTDLASAKGNRGWLVDEEKLPLVRQLLELFRTGRYSCRALLQIANEDMGLRTPQHKRLGGRKLYLSHLMGTILKNPVYAGFFFTQDGERHELQEHLPRVITEGQYWEIQKILGNKGRPRASKNKLDFAYTGQTSCGGCGGVVVAEHKFQIICDCRKKFARTQTRTNCPACGVAIKRMKKPTNLHYIFYHCTRRKDPTCREGSVQELYIDNELASYYKENLKISKDLHDWCLENLSALDTNDAKNGTEKKASLEATLAKKRNEYKELVLMKARGLISEDDFVEVKKGSAAEIEALERALKACGRVDKASNRKARRAFELSLGIDEIFKNGSPQEKKALLSEIGSNLTIQGKKLNVYNTGVYKKIMDGLLTARKENPAFEPRNYQANKDKTEVFASVCPTLLRGLDSNQDDVIQSHVSYH